MEKKTPRRHGNCAMNEEAEQSIRERVCWLLKGGGAHESFDSMVHAIPAEKRGVRAAGTPYTPWRLLEHMRMAQHDILEYVRDPEYTSPPHPAGFWPDEEAPPDDDAWRRSVEQFRTDNEALRMLVTSPDSELTGELAHTAAGHTILRAALLAGDHNAYHLGELAVVRRLIGAFPVDNEAPDNI